MTKRRKIFAGLLTSACLFSMMMTSALGAATSRQYTIYAYGSTWADAQNGGAPITKVRNGTASGGRYGVYVGTLNDAAGKNVVLKTRMHSSGHSTVGSCDVYSGTYNWATNSGQAGQTYHINGKRQYSYDAAGRLAGWWQADEN